MAILIYLLFIVGLIWFSGLYNPGYVYVYTIPLFVITGFYLLFKRKEIFLPVWLLPLPFLSIFPLLFKVESVQGTFDEYLVWCALFAFGTLLIQVKERAVQFPVLLLAINWTTVVGTYLVLLDVFSVPHFVLSLSKELSGLGERLSGFLQYPNAFATLLASMILFHLVYAVKESKKGWTTSHLLLPLFSWPLFLLTESRGAWLVFIVVWLLSFYVISKEKHARYLVSSTSTFLCGTIVYTLIVLDESVTITWLTLVAVIGFAVILWWMEKKNVMKKLPSSRNLHLVPFSLTVGLILLISDLYWKGAFYRLLPHSLQQRLLFNFDTFSERVLYWKDALAHWDEFSFTGLGGKAWRIFMYRIQSSPYLTSEVHNSYLDVWIEMGLLGLLFILFLLIRTGWQLFKERSFAFPAFVFLLLHGFFEFTFSYPILLFYLLILGLCQEKVSLPKTKLVPLILAFVILVSGTWLSITFAKAESEFHRVESAVTKEEALAAVREAHVTNPWQTQYVRFAVEHQLLSIEEQTAWLNKAISYERNHSWLLYHAAKAAEENGEEKKARILYQRSLDTNRYENRNN